MTVEIDLRLNVWRLPTYPLFHQLSNTDLFLHPFSTIII
jgi:hypothetical protein